MKERSCIYHDSRLFYNLNSNNKTTGFLRKRKNIVLTFVKVNFIDPNKCNSTNYRIIINLIFFQIFPQKETSIKVHHRNYNSLPLLRILSRKETLIEIPGSVGKGPRKQKLP